ncbi:hypothetical protein GSI01S_39_00570 [Gordonia sihwensis NBRC 108236]|uniref:Uncharacterized protein n=1 Tax=Gordonia sihwensis NBRC 108236 TaxID=1223544 RepID=L7LP42_9ACTN|nr:hypothetical protein GSI01S_39_00570 [Gordonia sihwensis NBRC 108236]
MQVNDPQGGTNTRWSKTFHLASPPKQVGFVAYPYLNNYIRCEIWVNGNLKSAHEQEGTTRGLRCGVTWNS